MSMFVHVCFLFSEEGGVVPTWTVGAWLSRIRRGRLKYVMFVLDYVQARSTLQ